jgi:hypothetical protein
MPSTQTQRDRARYGLLSRLDAAIRRHWAAVSKDHHKDRDGHWWLVKTVQAYSYGEPVPTEQEKYWLVHNGYVTRLEYDPLPVQTIGAAAAVVESETAAIERDDAPSAW